MSNSVDNSTNKCCLPYPKQVYNVLNFSLTMPQYAYSLWEENYNCLTY